MKSNKFFCSVLVVMFLFLLTSRAHAQSQAAPAQDMAVVEAKPSFLFVNVIGDKEKFEENHWTSRNSSGGLDSINISRQLNHQDSLDFEGRAIAGNNDYLANLSLVREGVGSLTVAFKEFRKYYDGTGGFYPLIARTYNYPVELDRDLHLDIGSFKIEGILAKEDSPEYALSYERNFREGSKSTLHWGKLTGTAAITPNVVPGWLETDETVDRVRLGVKKLTKDSEVSGEQSYEHVSSEARNVYSNALVLATGATTSASNFENVNSDFYSTVVRLSKDLNKKLSVNCGMLYNRYVGGSLDNEDTITGMDNFARIEQNTATLFPNLSYAPFKDLFMSFGVKGEFSKKIGSANYNRITGTTAGEGINIKSETAQQSYSQNLQLKYSGIRNSALYADAQLGKRIIDQREYQDSFGNTLVGDIFRHKVDTVVDNTNFTVGYKWYANSKLNITAEDRYKSESTNNDQKDKLGDVNNNPTYRGFISVMQINSNTPLVKLNYKPARWINYNLGYTYESSTYAIQTLVSGDTLYDRYNANIYSLETTLTPSDALYFTLFYQKKYGSNKTRASDISSAFMLPEFITDVDVASLTCNYAPTAKTTIRASYAMSKSSGFRDFSATTLPLGTDSLSQDISLGFEHKLNKDTSLELKYTFSQYAEPSNDGIDNYKANLIYTALKKKF